MSAFSVKKPYTVLVGVILVIVLGIVSFTKMTTDLLPNISLPYVIVMTTYPGASPETVEMVVTKPVESSMATVSNIESISSISSENYSMVILEFSQSADMNAASLEIRETLDQIKTYWDDSVGNPIIMKLNPDMLPVMIAAAGVEGMDHAQISTYVNNEIVPALESIEGVASVSVTGLLEESVNVIIRQEKVDAINKKVFAAIDDKMAEAEEELADGKEKLEDARKEIEDGKKELADGRRELADGESDLESGKRELDDKQEETAVKLAETKRDLLTAKNNLDSSKLSLTTNLTTAKTLHENITALNAAAALIVNAPGTYQTSMAGMAASVSGGDAQGGIKYKETIESLKKSYLENTMIQQMAGASAESDAIFSLLKSLDWTDANNFPLIYGSLSTISSQGSTQLYAQRDNLADSLNALTNGMGLSAYEALVNGTVKTLDEKLAQVNAGLVEVEKGHLTAAIEFANANAGISLGEYQMDLIKSQLETAEEQMKTGLDQLLEAEEQLIDGEEQLEEARESAYEKADMREILTVDTIKGLLTAQNFSMPAGYVTEDGIDYLVRVGDKPATVEELQALPLMDLHMEGVPVITLGDVADVFYTDNADDIYANVNGESGVMLTIQKQTGYSTGAVSDLLLARFDKLMEADPDLTMIAFMDQGIYIDLVMDSIISNILFGAFLAIFILLIFLKDIRPTLVVALSIPVSLVTAIVCMYFSGVTLNVISLSGLALGIGMLVDNSIVVIENIYRLRGEGYSMRDAAIEGAREVTGAIAASTLTTICVFLPIVFTEGITRQLFVDMGLTIAYSLLASLLIALTAVPAMSSVMLTKAKDLKEGKFYNAVISAYEKVLGWSLTRKPVIFLLVLALLVVSILASLSKGTAFMPDMDSTQMTVSVQLEKDATLKETAGITDQVVERILEIEDIQDVGAMTSGSALSLLGGSGGGSNNAASIYVVAKKDKTMSNEEIASIIIEKTADLDAEITVDTSSMDLSALGGSGISIQVRGRDLDTLQVLAAEVAAIVESVEGTQDVSDGMEEAGEELRIIINRDKAVEHGLTTAQVFTQISAKLAQANSATTLVTAENDVNVYVMHGNDITLTRELVRLLDIKGTDADGNSVKIPLNDIAAFEVTQSLNSINRADQTRYISVSAAIADGYNIGNVSGVVENRLADYQLPEGYQLVFSGENEMINDAMEQVTLMLLLALVFIYLIMVAQFQSLLSPFIIMFTIPLAFTGGFMGLFISGSEVSVIALIGFVMLSGIIVNNGIVLIDYINQLRTEGKGKRESIMEAGRTRLRPVLMTALTTILAMSTMVFSSDMGAEMARPMAIVTIGGLLYGTLLTLIVIPCIYDAFHREKKNKEPELLYVENEGSDDDTI